MSPDEVAELSRLLDEALALEPALLEPWLGDLERTKPRAAQRLRDMLRKSEVQDDDAVLPKLPTIDTDDAVARADERVGPYRLVQEIGRGGMGSVWLAERADGTFKRRVALKLPRLAWASGLAKRMTRERDIGALLEHPNIARLYDAGVDVHGRPYIAMEYIDGQPLDVYCREHMLDLRARLKLFVQVVQAVAYAHGRLIIHRDLKPANLLVDANGEVHLLDFGIAKLLDETGPSASELTQEQGRLLTLNYASPEQITGRPPGVTADVYSLGVVLFELLTGTLPYTLKRNTLGAIEDAILAGDAPVASSRVADKQRARDLRGDIDAILAKAIKPEPDERYPTADAFATDIKRYLDGQTIFARPDSGWYRLRKGVVRHRVPVIAASVVIAVSIVGGAATLIQSRRAADEAERTRVATAFVSELFRVNATQQMPMNDGAPRSSQAMFVDRGAQLIETRFQRQPELKAEMYGVVGRVYADLGVDPLATEYATRQLETLRAQRASAPHIARSLMLLSEVALIARRGVDAEEYARQAVDALPREDKLVPDALALLARVQVDNGKNAEAAQSLARAKKSLEDHGEPKSAAQAWLLFIDGELLARRNRFDDGKPFYAAAIAQALEVEGPTSSAAIGIRLLLAERLINRNRADEAREFGDPAIAALESLGGASSIRAVRWKAFLQIRKFENRLAGHAETMAVFEDVSSFLQAQSSSIPAEVLAEIDFYKARAYLQWGEFTLAKPLLDSSATLLQRSTQSVGRKFGLAVFLGIAAMYLGDHSAADKFLRERMELRIKRGWGNVPFAAFDWAYIALNLSLDGRHNDAEAFLSDAPAFGNVQGDSVADYTRVIPETLARIRLHAGNVSGAKQALPLTDPPYEDNLDLFSTFQLRGEVMCAAGEHAVGLAQLTRSIDSLSRTTGPNHPGLARLRAVAGLCALLLGNREQAEELANLARSAFVAQSNVGSYFKEPLNRLEDQLRRRAI